MVTSCKFIKCEEMKDIVRYIPWRSCCILHSFYINYAHPSVWLGLPHSVLKPEVYSPDLKLGTQFLLGLFGSRCSLIYGFFLFRRRKLLSLVELNLLKKKRSCFHASTLSQSIPSLFLPREGKNVAWSTRRFSRLIWAGKRWWSGDRKGECPRVKCIAQHVNL